jgi:hypothetical protein
MAISLSNNPLGGIIFLENIWKLSPNNDATIGTDVEKADLRIRPVLMKCSETERAPAPIIMQS